MLNYPEYPKDLPKFLRYDFNVSPNNDSILTTKMQNGLDRNRMKFEVEPQFVTVSIFGNASEIFTFEQWRKKAINTFDWFIAPIELAKPSAGFEPEVRKYYVRLNKGLPRKERLGYTYFKMTFDVILLDIDSDLEIDLGDYPEYILYADVLDCAVNLRLPKYE